MNPFHRAVHGNDASGAPNMLLDRPINYFGQVEVFNVWQHQCHCDGPDL
jgi:hypothetical protein